MLVPSSQISDWPPVSASQATKLFVTGSGVGPLVDSLHNQCLLHYNIAPIQINCWFASSWTVPPLLGVAYVVLGAILPRVTRQGIQAIIPSGVVAQRQQQQQSRHNSIPQSSETTRRTLRNKALLAVLTTACLIQLSAYLETTGTPNGVMCLSVAALLQWALLDSSVEALLVASLASVAGPLAELPFVGHGVWTYLETAGDYVPLAHVDHLPALATFVLGTDHYQGLALAHITGPCYFAVTMDAIALGRWYATSTEKA
jgi:hypothetical protein